MAVRQVALSEIADIIRSKNAGPYRITFDIMFKDPKRYAQVRDSGSITRESVAKAFGIPVEDVTSFFDVDMANAIKATLRRPLTQSAFGESDVYGCQQHAPLLDLTVSLKDA